MLKILEPIWDKRRETASRLRGRIEAVLDYARVREWRDGENPARWRGHLDMTLPGKAKIRSVVHHPALPWKDLPAFMAELRAQTSNAARALEFLILTAGRTGEVLGARWSEIELGASVWTRPAERMKARKAHRVPLSPAAVAVLIQMARQRSSLPDPPIFPGQKAGRPLSQMAMAMLLRRMECPDITVHGFRSTFRDWVEDTTSTPGNVAEQALAHAIPNKVEAAYRRGDLFERRIELMRDWSEYCAGGNSACPPLCRGTQGCGPALAAVDVSGMVMAKRKKTGLRGPCDPLVTGLQVANAHHMSRLLAAGLKLSTGELQQLDTMPPGVRDAVLACYRANSRYLPKFIKKQRQAGPMPLGPKSTRKSRRYDYWKDINPRLAAAILLIEEDEDGNEVGNDEGDEDDAVSLRHFRVYLPSNVSGFGQVISAFARHCEVSPGMIRLYMKSARKFDSDSSAPQDRQLLIKARTLLQRLEKEPELDLTPAQKTLLSWVEDFLIPDKDKKRRS